jgi:thermostable 8-oxoguanine DNA glycosylase
MGVQIGFDGSVKLATRDAASIRQVLDMSVDKYAGYALDIAHEPTPEVVYWRTIFALLSVHTAFEATNAAYLDLREGFDLEWHSLTERLSAVKAGQWVIQFAGVKATAILAFDREFSEAPERFTSAETHEAWRDEFDKLWGLARVKASFAVCLIDPTASDVVCIDRHMARLLVDPTRGDSYVRMGEYDKAENRIRNLAADYGVSPFVVQWCLWDAQRGHVETHASLRAA